MKRSRRVVLTLMGGAAVGAVSMGFVEREPACGPGFTSAPGPDGRMRCRYGGFGGTLHRIQGHGHGQAGHGHAGHGGGGHGGGGHGGHGHGGHGGG
jgi:hypothetical protein